MRDDDSRRSAVRLRQVTATDADIIMGWREEPSARTYQPLRQVAIGELRTMLIARGATPITQAAEGEIQWIVETDDGPVGWVTVTISSREHGIASLGYTIGERFRGRGYASAAVGQVIPIAFDSKRLDLWRLEAVAAVENMASRRVLERNGLIFEGIARGYLVIGGVRVDHARYAMLRSDWQQDVAIERRR